MCAWMQGADSLYPLGDHHARLATHCGLARRRGRNAGRPATWCLHALLCMKQYCLCGRPLPDSVAYIKLGLFLPHFFVALAAARIPHDVLIHISPSWVCSAYQLSSNKLCSLISFSAASGSHIQGSWQKYRRYE